MMQAYGVGNGIKMVSGVAKCFLVDKVEWQLPVATPVVEYGERLCFMRLSCGVV